MLAGMNIQLLHITLLRHLVAKYGDSLSVGFDMDAIPIG